MINLKITQIETIIWDWNGTLLNDRALCVQSINKLLKERSLPQLTLEHYLNVFGFPVSDYYKRIGFNFDLEPFEIPAKQFIKHYADGIKDCTLHYNVENVLHTLQSNGIRQVILSAMEQSKLEESVAHLNIRHYFEEISGLNNDYAATKEENGVLLLHKNGFNHTTTVLIGDTIHDFEVAQKLNCNCILIAHGHQHKTKLKETGTLVLDSLEALPEIIQA